MKERFANRSKSICESYVAGVDRPKPKHYAEDTENQKNIYAPVRNLYCAALRGTTESLP